MSLNTQKQIHESKKNIGSKNIIKMLGAIAVDDVGPELHKYVPAPHFLAVG
jgi:hypothetical protein